MANVLVSIALCTYNGEKYLEEQLDSLLAQTYSPIEIVIVDDHSSDGTRGLLELYRSKNPAIQIHYNEVNLGFNKNFQKAISHSKGKYVAICDQDDIWKYNKVEKLLSEIGSYDLIFSNSELINSKGILLGRRLLENFEMPGSYKAILLENFVTGHTAMFRRKLIDSIFPLPEFGFYDWWIGFVAMYSQKVTFIDECLSQYRIHDDSVIQKKLLARRSTQKADSLRQLGVFLSYKGLELEAREYITKLKTSLDQSTNSVRDPIFVELLKYFPSYFPKRARKNLFSRFRFLKRFLKGSPAA